VVPLVANEPSSEDEESSPQGVEPVVVPRELNDGDGENPVDVAEPPSSAEAVLGQEAVHEHRREEGYTSVHGREGPILVLAGGLFRPICRTNYSIIILSPPSLTHSCSKPSPRSLLSRPRPSVLLLS